MINASKQTKKVATVKRWYRGVNFKSSRLPHMSPFHGGTHAFTSTSSTNITNITNSTKSTNSTNSTNRTVWMQTHLMCVRLLTSTAFDFNNVKLHPKQPFMEDLDVSSFIVHPKTGFS